MIKFAFSKYNQIFYYLDIITNEGIIIFRGIFLIHQNYLVFYHRMIFHSCE